VIDWSRRRRLRRIAAPDGRPAATGWPYPKPPAFTPTPVDTERARQRIDKVVAGLIPHAFDEATGHLPMNLINSWADQWIDQVDGEFESYRHEVRREIGLATAALAELDSAHDADARRLAELDLDRQTVFGELTDSDTAAATSTSDSSESDPDASTEERRVSGQRTGAGRPDAGYRMPGLVAGRSFATKLHIVALLVAALADFGAFAQVVQLVLTNQAAWVSYLVVLGLTTGVLYLAHAVGTMVRDRVAGHNAARWTWIVLGTAGWAAIGLVAYRVRLLVTDEQGQPPSGPLSADPSAVPSAPDSTALPGAMLFLALFVGTGLVAAIGAYVTHNPFAGQYRMVSKRHAAAAVWEGESGGAKEAVAKRLRHLRRALRKARALRDREHRRRRHFAEELKEYARTLMANHVQDPAFSDALFDKDRLPYHSALHVNGSGRHPRHANSPGAPE
jgi:hypothetical protein